VQAKKPRREKKTDGGERKQGQEGWSCQDQGGLQARPLCGPPSWPVGPGPEVFFFFSSFFFFFPGGGASADGTALNRSGVLIPDNKRRESVVYLETVRPSPETLILPRLHDQGQSGRRALSHRNRKLSLPSLTSTLPQP